MPKLAMETHKIGGSNFTFQAARIDDLGATEYTLVSVAVDVTGSVYGFEQELRQVLVTAIDTCQQSPRSDNLMARSLLFSTSLPKGLQELHGFKPLADIDAKAYPDLNPGGLTPLADATFSSVGAMADYGEQLMSQDYLVNGIAFIITDGGDNASTATPAMIKQQLADIRKQEKLESILTILIGINVANCRDLLEEFQREANIDKFIDAGDATPKNLAKVANFISQSVSSQSQSIGTGGPSQAIAATI